MLEEVEKHLREASPKYFDEMKLIQKFLDAGGRVSKTLFSDAGVGTIVEAIEFGLDLNGWMTRDEISQLLEEGGFPLAQSKIKGRVRDLTNYHTGTGRLVLRDGKYGRATWSEAKTSRSAR